MDAVPFAQSYRPGKKPFDWYVAQVSVTPERAKNGRLLELLLLREPGARRTRERRSHARSRWRISGVQAGAQLGTTSYKYIANYIKPSQKPLRYDTNDLAVQALQNGQIDGIVVDMPTAFYVTGVQVDDGVIVGRLPVRGGGSTSAWSSRRAIRSRGA